MRLLCLWLAGVVAATAQITLQDTIPVRFGEALEDVAKRLNERPFDGERARAGIDQMLATTSAQLMFDSGKLWRVTLNERHRLGLPLAAFAEAWKNFDRIGEVKPIWSMPREEFDAYFAVWKSRAALLGKRENVDYWITETGQGAAGHRLTVTYAPWRRLWGTGELTGDTWVFRFRGAEEAKHNPRWEAGQLVQMEITDDRFGTRNRAPEEAAGAPRGRGSPPQRLRAQGARFPDGTEVYFGQALDEVQGLLGAKATASAFEAKAGDVRSMMLPALWLFFDRERLARIGYRRTIEAPAPFPESWRNFNPIGEQQVQIGMTKTAFLEYLEAWQGRAEQMGLVKDRHFSLRPSTTERTDAMIVMMMNPRSAVTGEIRPDMWIVNFNVRARPQTVTSLEASRGEFHSRPSTSAKTKQPPKTKISVAPKLEVPPVEMPKVELPRLDVP